MAYVGTIKTGIPLAWKIATGWLVLVAMFLNNTINLYSGVKD